MVVCVLDQRWTIEQTAERFQVDPKTMRKWRDRFLAEDGLLPEGARQDSPAPSPAPLGRVSAGSTVATAPRLIHRSDTNTTSRASWSTST
jgi:transposase-like protein